MRTGKFFKALAALIGFCALSSAGAQDWPRQAVHLVIPYAPGGAVDIMGRVLAERLGQRWNQTVVVDNRAGAAEIIAAQVVARARPDGHTLLLGTEVGLQTNPFLFSKLPYDPRTDFTPITRVIEGALIYVVKSDSPFKSMDELLAAARQAPGKLSYGSSGTGGAIHLTTNWLARVAGNVRFTHAPYKGSAPTMSDLLAGVIDFTAAPLSVVAPYVQDGRMRALATSGREPIASLPGVPTFAQLGYSDAVSHFMFGLVGPANMPPELAARIANDVSEVMRDKENQARNVEPFGFTVAVETPEQFAAFLESNRDFQQARVKAADVRLD